MDDDLVQVIYHSEATVDDAEAAPCLQDILSVARAKNAQHDVSGALLFGFGRFAQVIEGRADVIEDVMQSIRRDPRHANITQLPRAKLTGGRQFATWAMAGLISRTDRLTNFADRNAAPADATNLSGSCIVALLRWFLNESAQRPEPEADCPWPHMVLAGAVDRI